MAAKLSDDILSIIFLKLPIKSLLRCRSVCKSWRQLLCEPHFVKMHLNHISQHHHKLLLRNSDCFYSLDYETSHRNAVPRDFPLEITPLKVALWNPSTGDYKILPSADPSVNDNQIVGFGYDSSIDDYKIVRIIPYYFVKAENEPGKAYCGLQVDMYSLKTNSWKIIRDLPRRDVVRHAPLIFNGEFRGRVSVSVNKSIYWLLGSKIIGFDLKNEKFKELSWPCNMQPDFHKCLKSLSVMGGYLLNASKSKLGWYVQVLRLIKASHDHGFATGVSHLNLEPPGRFADAFDLMHNRMDDNAKLVVWALTKNDGRKEERIKSITAAFQNAKMSWSLVHR
ncbi:hypothetical protein LguiB_014564 [Lonicera macranthoides]